MRAFAEWLSASRYRALLVAALLGLVPWLGVASAGVIVLVTLRRGWMEGLLVAAGAAALLVLAEGLMGRAVATAIANVAGMWLPSVGLAELLRRSRSLSLCVQTVAIGASLLVTILFLIGDPVRAGAQIIDALAPVLEGAGVVLPLDVKAALARIVTGMLVALLTVALASSLLLGRWWETLLVRPGTFAQEFRVLRMGQVLAGFSAAVFLAALVSRTAMLDNMALVLMVGFVLQGLAVVHAVAGAQGVHPGWIVVLYAALVLVTGYAAAALGLLGYLDNWVNIRARMRR